MVIYSIFLCHLQILAVCHRDLKLATNTPFNLFFIIKVTLMAASLEQLPYHGSFFVWSGVRHRQTNPQIYVYEQIYKIYFRIRASSGFDQRTKNLTHIIEITGKRTLTNTNQSQKNFLLIIFQLIITCNKKIIPVCRFNKPSRPFIVRNSCDTSVFRGQQPTMSFFRKRTKKYCNESGNKSSEQSIFL